MSWRDHCTPIIKRVLSDTKGQDDKVIRKALHEAYPYGQRQYHPYKIWCDEIRRQRGLKPRLGTRTAMEADERQAEMFR